MELQISDLELTDAELKGHSPKTVASLQLRKALSKILEWLESTTFDISTPTEFAEAMEQAGINPFPKENP